MTTTPITVAKFIAQQIERSGRLQEDIASDCGFVNRNMISMIRAGVTKLPLSKIGVMAKALDVDPSYLLRLALTEYMPEAWAVFEQVLGRSSFVTEAELDLLGLIRCRSGGVMLDMSNIDARHQISDAIDNISVRREQGHNALHGSVREGIAIPD